MSTADATTGDHPADPSMFRLAHYEPVLILALVAANIADHYLHTPVTSVLALGMFIPVGMATVASWRHERSLCQACVGDFPLDPQGQAQRRGRWLRIFHLSADRPFVAAAVLLAVSVASFWVFWAMVAVWSWWALEAWAGRWHRLLEPWCPFCRGGGGGPHECVPEPTPDPSLSDDPRAVTR